MFTNKAILAVYQLPEECTLELVVRDASGNIVDSCYAELFQLRGNVKHGDRQAQMINHFNQVLDLLRTSVGESIDSMIRYVGEQGTDDTRALVIRAMNDFFPAKVGEAVFQAVQAAMQGPGMLTALLTKQLEFLGNATLYNTRMLEALVNILDPKKPTTQDVAPIDYINGPVKTPLWDPFIMQHPDLAPTEKVDIPQMSAPIPGRPQVPGWYPPLAKVGTIMPDGSVLYNSGCDDVASSVVSEPPHECNPDDGGSVKDSELELVSASEVPENDDALRLLEELARSQLPPRQQVHSMIVPQRSAAGGVVVTPDYIKEGSKIDMQPYHSYGGPSEDHYVPMGTMLNYIKHDCGFVIPLEDPRHSECALWTEMDLLRDEAPRTGPYYRYDLNLDHFRECLARHSHIYADGTRLIGVYVFEFVDGERWTLEICSYRDRAFRSALLARANPRLMHALGYTTNFGRFVIAMDPRMNLSDFPVDVMRPAEGRPLCVEMESRGAGPLMDELDFYFERKWRNIQGRAFQDKVPKSLTRPDDLLEALTALGKGTAFSLTPQRGSCVPTTMARMLRDRGAHDWAQILEKMAGVLARAAAEDGNPAEAFYREVSTWQPDEKAKVMQLVTWKRLATNFGVKVAMRALGVRNGYRVSRAAIPKGVMALNNCDLFGGGHVCPECHSVFRTAGERKMCTTLDLMFHQLFLLSTGEVWLGALMIHDPKTRQFKKLKDVARGQNGGVSYEEVKKVRQFMVRFPFGRMCPH
uniref:VP5 n=1 Tax=Eyach virus TaxID=62352 RepID=A0A8G0QFU6_9REOV|nr:VP5 [Eyach virus]